MAKIFLLSPQEFDEKDNYPLVDEFISPVNSEKYTNMIKWLVDNDINFHAEVINHHSTITMKDEDVAGFKLRWI